MHFSRRSSAWAVWLILVFGLFNGCAGHRECRESGKWLEAGGWAPTPATGIRALRALGTDDADIQRYHAYANAVLGLPYQGLFIRPMEGWKVDTRADDDKHDGADPDVVPPIVPARPLVPYRDFLVEYPPAFFLFAIPPALVARDIDSYYFLFSFFTAVLLTAALAMLADAARQIAPDRNDSPAGPSLLFFAALCALAIGPIIVRRYDAVVSLSLCMLLWGCVTKRAWAAGLGFGLGVAAKGMPILLAPIVLAYFFATNRRKDALVTGLVAAALGVLAILPFARSAGVHMLDMFAYHGQRPLQIESTGGALLVIGRLFNPAFASASQTYGSMNVVGGWDAPLRVAASVLPFGALVAMSALAWRDMRSARTEAARARVLVRASCAALAFIMVLGKVFSPQYLTWLLPLGMLASLLDEELATRRKLLAALVLTQIIFPFCYCVHLASNLSPIFGVLVLARNLLVFAWAWQMATASRAECEAAAGSERGAKRQSVSVAAAKSAVASSR